MTKYQFRNPRLIFRMLNNINTITIINHNNGAIILNSNIDISNRQRIIDILFNLRLHPYNVISTIYDTFVKQLKQTRNIANIFFDNSIISFIHNPYIRINSFNRTDISIWIIQNMLFIGLLLNIKV